MKPPKKSKYNSTKTIVDGITFDSRRESDYYCYLKMRQAGGEIAGFELQPEFVLQDSYKRDGKTIRAIKYRADFRVIYPDNRQEIIDCKGMKTPAYKLKKKILLAKYPELEFIEA